MSAPETVADQIAAQIRRLEAGGELENVVDPARGY
jgi:glyoxylate/hydroxypyruvate reductase A